MRTHRALAALLCGCAILATSPLWSQVPQSDEPTKKLAHDVLKELIEINTTDSVGSTTLAANAMAKRFKAAGFADADMTVVGPNDRKGNLEIGRASCRERV